ncbi:hypothetical protein OUZ56_021181 [Daphnia magna]|uniref:Uncharacterized protein n=1 Tax=Daphnia magna TaxID=35525 RepID=A0ABQ9ZGM4_9CRUS|nr:hypothetical protein OUZ56_021181 [Daphnia magna]
MVAQPPASSTRGRSLALTPTNQVKKLCRSVRAAAWGSCHGALAVATSIIPAKKNVDERFQTKGKGDNRNKKKKTAFLWQGEVVCRCTAPRRRPIDRKTRAKQV